MDLRQASGLARPLDPGYRTNRWILALILGVLAGAWMLRGSLTGDWLAAGGLAVLAAIALFLAWALGRELDPPSESAAFLGAGLALPPLAAAAAGWLPLPDLAALVLVLLAMRVLNRTSGNATRPLDGLVVFGLAVWLAIDANPIYLLAAVIAVILDGLLPPAQRRRAVLGAAAAGVALVLVLVLGPAAPPSDLEPIPLLIAAAAGAVFSETIRATGRLEGAADDRSAALSPLRVRAGQLLALLTGLALVVWIGAAALTALAPLWAAMAASGLSRLVHRPGP